MPVRMLNLNFDDQSNSLTSTDTRVTHACVKSQRKSGMHHTV